MFLWDSYHIGTKTFRPTEENQMGSCMNNVHSEPTNLESCVHKNLSRKANDFENYNVHC